MNATWLRVTAPDRGFCYRGGELLRCDPGDGTWHLVRQVSEEEVQEAIAANLTTPELFHSASRPQLTLVKGGQAHA